MQCTLTEPMKMQFTNRTISTLHSTFMQAMTSLILHMKM